MYRNLAGKKRRHEPPKGMVFTGSGDFIKQGQTFLKYFKKYGELKPHHRVLDVGSGMGRMAVPLIDFLDEKGSYEGFDVVEKGVKWCKNHITESHPRFRFKHISLQNDLYTSGENNAVNFKFPYPGNEFDFCIVTSVFTHMLPSEVENYLFEINRVLKPGGKCLATFFILTEESLELSKKTDSFYFPYKYSGYRLMDKDVKSANVAFEKRFLFDDIISKTKLDVEQFLPGRWCGRKKEDTVDFQDTLILSKKYEI